MKQGLLTRGYFDRLVKFSTLDNSNCETESVIGESGQTFFLSLHLARRTHTQAKLQPRVNPTPNKEPNA